MATIGDVAKKLGVSTHTLRYYEKIELLPPIAKSPAGRRNYHRIDIERVRFIKSAQQMHFSLAQIKTLLELDSSSDNEKRHAQGMVTQKLLQIEESLRDLNHLKAKLNTMLHQCRNSRLDQKCPILQGMKQRQD